jgi:hypothetical protein
MLSEVVRKHLLKERKTPLNDDDLEIAIYVGWNARNEEIERLKSENARYREALDKAEKALKFYRREFD